MATHDEEIPDLNWEKELTEKGKIAEATANELFLQVDDLTAENARLRYLLSWAADTIADLSGGGQHLVIMREINEALEQETTRCMYTN